MEFIYDIVRSIFIFVDSIVYPMAAFLYQLFTNLTKIMLFSTTDAENFTSRIYILIGIFMMFKVAISLISMYVTPDSFYNDKEGAGNLVKKVLIALVLLGLTPWIFKQAFKIQYAIIENNIIPRIVLGVSNTPKPEAIGNNMVGSVFLGFYEPGKDADNTKKEILIGNYNGRVKKNVNEKENGDYANLYRPMFSTIAGIFIIWILLTFCFDLAIRSVKLGLLQLIAPIPILMSIDPKNGKQKLDSWIQATISTFVSLFVKVAIINFGIYLIYLVSQLQYGQVLSDGTIAPTQLEGFDGTLTAAFLILGILMFVKDAPKLISDVLGIKMEGSFKLNPFSSLMAAPVAGAVAGLAAKQGRKGVGAVVGGIDSKAHGGSFSAGAAEGSKTMADKKGLGALNFGAARTTSASVKKAKADERKAINDYQIKQTQNDRLAYSINPNNDIRWDDVSAAGYSSPVYAQSISELSAAQEEYDNSTKPLFEARTKAENDMNTAREKGDNEAFEKASSRYSGLSSQIATHKEKLSKAEKGHKEIQEIYKEDAKREKVFRKTYDKSNDAKREAAKAKSSNQPNTSQSQGDDLSAGTF